MPDGHWELKEQLLGKEKLNEKDAEDGQKGGQVSAISEREEEREPNDGPLNDVDRELNDGPLKEVDRELMEGLLKEKEDEDPIRLHELLQVTSNKVL